MLNYGWNAENNQANDGRQANYTMAVDNAFIPDSVRQQMIAQGIQNFTLGSASIENLTNHSRELRSQRNANARALQRCF